jgi:hypothetical protein
MKIFAKPRRAETLFQVFKVRPFVAIPAVFNPFDEKSDKLRAAGKYLIGWHIRQGITVRRFLDSGFWGATTPDQSGNGYAWSQAKEDKAR